MEEKLENEEVEESRLESERFRMCGAAGEAGALLEQGLRGSYFGKDWNFQGGTGCEVGVDISQGRHFPL